MRATGEFVVEAFAPLECHAVGAPQTATRAAIATMTKRYEGEVVGVSTTIFTYAMSPDDDAGGYVAMESFEGALLGRTGTFTFFHSATTSGRDRADESFVILPSSGTGALRGIAGAGGISVASDGSHRVWFEYRFLADE